jgi:CheY-like chemotaxis protein
MPKTRVLVVEDEGIVAMNTKLSLIGMGYEVLPIAISGKTALKLAREKRPDIVLMDIRLRGKMDGVDTAIEIQGIIDAPIIYITAHTDEQTVERANSTNPSAFLKKPVEDKVLGKAIRAALRKK